MKAIFLHNKIIFPVLRNMPVALHVFMSEQGCKLCICTGKRAKSKFEAAIKFLEFCQQCGVNEIKRMEEMREKFLP
jgi:hypothetical protein